MAKSESYLAYTGTKRAVDEGRDAVVASAVSFQRLLRTTMGATEGVNHEELISMIDSVMGRAREVSRYYEKLHTQACADVKAEKPVNVYKENVFIMSGYINETSKATKKINEQLATHGKEPFGEHLHEVLSTHMKALEAADRAHCELAWFYVTTARKTI